MSAKTARSHSSLDRYGFLDAPEGRRRRGRRITEALVEFGDVDIAAARILDIGCSAGTITEQIAQVATMTIGIDADFESVAYAMRANRQARFVAASGDRLPFAEATFDAIVCNHVYEHVADAAALMREVHRVLRPGGACYFAAGHTLQLVEPHYRVPLLSWLPRRIASAVLRATGRGSSYDERFLPPWRLARLFEPFARADFISPPMLRDPKRYGFPAIARWGPIARPLLALAGAPITRLAPTWIYMLRKTGAGQDLRSPSASARRPVEPPR